ncbi:MAG: hypothetical protein O7G30_05285 [Proteobacteria bacterium]|nr:hypothetical protein [Pseudomonadota bacterium]
MSEPAPSTIWSTVAERGSIGALRFLAWFHNTLGQRASWILIYGAAVYFYLRTGVARAASRQYLEALAASPEGRAALGGPPTRLSVFRHILEFSINIFDRVVVWGGGIDAYRFTHDESGKLFSAARTGRGGILLSAHLGSFDMLRVLSDEYGLVVNVLMYTDNAERINRFFEKLDPRSTVRVIPLDPSSMRTTFTIRSCIERGEFVAVLADRLSPGARERVAQTTFLGRPTAFPLSPFLLGGVLGCPVFVALCVREGRSHYRTLLRSIGDRSGVPRAEREKYGQDLLERYVAILQEHCIRTPYQWFNFYPFWPKA